MTVRADTGLFLVTWLGGSAGAVLGSVLGGALGTAGLFTGALLGGAAASVTAVRFAAFNSWIPRAKITRVTIGAIAGFAAASLIATRTLSSPVGPVLSSLLIGVGAFVASRR